jgi:hypothetical protein
MFDSSGKLGISLCSIKFHAKFGSVLHNSQVDNEQLVGSEISQIETTRFTAINNWLEYSVLFSIDGSMQ